MKRQVPVYDFSHLGKAIKSARMSRGESRKKVCDEMNLSPRYLANIENNGQHPSLQIFYELATRYDISVDQFFYPKQSTAHTPERRYLDHLLDEMSDDGLRILLAAAKQIVDSEFGR